MRVLWFTNVPFPAACEALGRNSPVTGGWLASLGEALQATEKTDLMIVSFVVGKTDQSVFVGGIRHELIAIERPRFNKEFWFYPNPATRRKCCDLVASFQPDVVHIHGTEGSYGLLLTEGDIQCPAVVSLQGMLGAINRFEHGGLSVWDRLRTCTLRDMIGNHGIVRGAIIADRRAREVEKRILRSRAVFVGRTFYDRACLRAVNPQAIYCHCDEVMRSPFYTLNRDPCMVVPESIFMSASDNPRKGSHCLLKAVALLKAEFPNITVRAIGKLPTDSWLGTGYQRYLYRLMRQLQLEDCVTFLGELNDQAMAEELARAHVFALPSFADNSPNGLAEAMLMGTPAVVAFVGGIPSMVRHEETALCFPMGDELVMAECLRTLLLDKELAMKLALNAQRVARQRHDHQCIAQRMLEIYALAAPNS
jgi:glycosyltransferase involved in cell wall biosynthesis